MTVVSYLDTNQDKLFLNWNAYDRDNDLPYICQSKCPKGYFWFSSNFLVCFVLLNFSILINFSYLIGIQKCLGIVHSSTATLGDALFQCSARKARLVALESCNEIKLLLDETFDTFALTNQSYFIGTFGFEDPNDAIYRNWRNDAVYNS